MTTTITLTTAGADSGPFSIYSNSTGPFVLVISGVTKLDLTTGYNVTLPDGTTIARVQSTGGCSNYQDLTITTKTPTDIAPGVALYWHAEVGTYTAMTFAINRRRAGVVTYDIARVEQQTGQSTPTYYNSLVSISSIYPDNLQAGDEIQIVANSGQQIPGGGGTVSLTIDLQRSLRDAINYNVIETQTATGSFATTQIPVTIGSWYTIDPSMYLYEVNAVSQLV